MIVGYHVLLLVSGCLVVVVLKAKSDFSSSKPEVVVKSVKRCYFSNHRCFFDSCDSLDIYGNVVLCRYFRGGNKFTVRRVKVVLTVVGIVRVLIVVLVMVVLWVRRIGCMMRMVILLM